MSPVRETTSFSNRVRSIYLAADTRSPNTILDVFEATERLPAAKRLIRRTYGGLKSAQSGLGQAKKDRGNSPKLWLSCWCLCLLDIGSLLAENCYLPAVCLAGETNNSSAKKTFLL